MMSDYIHLTLMVFSIIGALGSVFLPFVFLTTTHDYHPRFTVTVWVLAVPIVVAMVLAHQTHFAPDLDQFQSGMAMTGWYFAACLLLGHFFFSTVDARVERLIGKYRKHSTTPRADEAEVDYSTPPRYEAPPFRGR